jgi:hypothetical protein
MTEPVVARVKKIAAGETNDFEKMHPNDFRRWLPRTGENSAEQVPDNREPPE